MRIRGLGRAERRRETGDGSSKEKGDLSREK